MKKIADYFFSTRAAGLYIILFALAIAIATFVENDFGTSAAQKIIFKARWFEFLLILFGVCLIVNMLRFKLIHQKKWATLMFHLSIIIILIGAGVTRYFGYEGMMHIREGSIENKFLSAETFLNFSIEKGGQTYAFNEPVYFASLGRNKLKRKYKVDGEVLDLEVHDFVPNPTKVMVTDPENGFPTLKVVTAGQNGREEYYLMQNDRLPLPNVMLDFSSMDIPQAFQISYRNDSLLFVAPYDIEQTVMATQTTDTIPAGQESLLRLRALYTNGTFNIVFGEFHPNAKVETQAGYRKMKSESMGAVHLTLTMNGEAQQYMLLGRRGAQGQPVYGEIGGSTIGASYGSKVIQLPFALELRDFIMERYPGTDNPSSYASEVTLQDSRKNLRREERIYMNNILDYGGYRFFQSSYDPDEQGTYLSVNNDAWGTWISYIGYFFLTLGMLLTFVSKKGRFSVLTKNLAKLRTMSGSVIIGLLCFTGVLFSQADLQAQTEPNEELMISEAHAHNFSSLIVQDHRGRFKPVNTLCNEVIRKISRKESLYGQNADQIFLGMTVFPENWEQVPLIHIGKHEKLKELLGVTEGLASYADFFSADRKYILMDEVRKAHETPAIDRGTLEKTMIKVDEKVNICSMVFSGRLLRIYPVVGDVNNKWISPADIRHTFDDFENQPFSNKFFPAYTFAISEAVKSGDWGITEGIVKELRDHQQEITGDVLPSKRKLSFEMLLNKVRIFAKLGGYYAILGLLILVLFFASVFRHSINREKLAKYAIFGLGFLFLLHTIGLGIRWYVSGHAPWSNGYESMIYIGWTTSLAGLIFARKSLGGLAATAILAATILLVATMSYMDPEITPLVPVLRSYWLTIHVSLEAGSYGFLMLGAIIGILNLLLMIVITDNNKAIVKRSVKELTYISEMTLIGGLVMVSIGTYLGGVWANESWGRYWGWDAKETWALVTILVYAFILHMRFIPGFRGVYAFNVASLFGFATVIMTYFGVNYYLSGLHSYAAGDPVPVPSFVYYTAVIFTVISLVALWRYTKTWKDE